MVLVKERRLAQPLSRATPTWVPNRERAMPSSGSSMRKLGPPVLACITMVLTCVRPIQSQQSSEGKATPALAQPSRKSAAGMGDDMMGATDLMPSGIMVGQAGRWMVGYTVMFDKMDGNLVGTNNIDAAAVLERFAATPTDMTMQMHTGMAMYAPTDRLSMRGSVLPTMIFCNGDSHGTHFNTHCWHELRRVREQRPHCACRHSRRAG